MAVVDVIKPFLFRLKMALKSNCCSFCEEQPCRASALNLCERCEQKLLMRPLTPLTMMGKTPIYAAYNYTHNLKSKLYGLKFQHNLPQGAVLAEWLNHYWQQLPLEKSLYQNITVVTIPAHQHGSTPHLDWIYRPFCSEQGYTYSNNALHWQRAIQPQHTLRNKRQRKQNIDQALSVNPEAIQALQAQDLIIVVDDLYTTGCTMQEALRALKHVAPHSTHLGLTLGYLPLAISRVNDP